VSARSKLMVIMLFALGILGMLAVLLQHCSQKKHRVTTELEDASDNNMNLSDSPSRQQPSSPPGKKWLSPTQTSLPRAERVVDPFVAQDPLKALDYQSAAFVQKTQRLQNRWQSGDPDSSWTGQMATYVAAQLSQAGIQGRVTEVACRTTLCRITIEFDSIEKLADINRFQYPENNEGFHTTYVGEGQHLGRLFVAPPGVSLSSIFANPSNSPPK